jgi:hypothetical protein
MNIIQLENRVREVRGLVDEENKRHEAAKYKFAIELEELEKSRYAIMHSFDMDSIQTAKKYIYTKGVKVNSRGDAYRTLCECIADCSTGFKKIRREYFGCKDYSGFWGQGCDCEYGYGPSHGSIVFSIGLWPDARKTIDSIPESDACAIVYYLNLLKDSDNRKGLLREHE